MTNMTDYKNYVAPSCMVVEIMLESMLCNSNFKNYNLKGVTDSPDNDYGYLDNGIY